MDDLDWENILEVRGPQSTQMYRMGGSRGIKVRLDSLCPQCYLPKKDCWKTEAPEDLDTPGSPRADVKSTPRA